MKILGVYFNTKRKVVYQ